MDRDCRAGKLGCVDCKRAMAKNLNKALEPIRDRRRELDRDRRQVDEILSEGSSRAKKVAQKTLSEVIAAMGI